MEMEDSPTTKRKASTTITPAQRIHELLAVDRDITQTLHSASLAIQSLTLSPPDPSADELAEEEASSGDDANKRAFESHTRAFFNQIQGISARLRRQAYALEEAGIIAAKQTSVLEEKQSQGRPAGSGNAAQQKPEQKMQITNGGLGNFDVGWLNSRRDEVGKRKEAELWAEAKSIAGRLGLNGSNDTARGDDGMDLDVDET